MNSTKMNYIIFQRWPPATNRLAVQHFGKLQLRKHVHREIYDQLFTLPNTEASAWTPSAIATHDGFTHALWPSSTGAQKWGGLPVALSLHMPPCYGMQYRSLGFLGGKIWIYNNQRFQLEERERNWHNLEIYPPLSVLNDR